MRAQLPPRHTLEIRRDALTRARKFFGIQSEGQLARLMGMDVGQMSRVVLGKSEPGTRFIAELLRVVGVEFFSQIFVVVPIDDKKTNGKVA
jgi:transcriptional regulator with XRE-family HTH domain